jgi:hypothetical protein
MNGFLNFLNTFTASLTIQGNRTWNWLAGLGKDLRQKPLFYPQPSLPTHPKPKDFDSVAIAPAGSSYFPANRTHK